MGAGKSSSESGFGKILGQIAEQIQGEVDPLRKQLIGQQESVLSGKIYGKNTIPLIQSGVQASRSAAGASLENTKASFAKAGAANSPFAMAVQQMVQQQGQFEQSQVPIQIAENIAGGANSMVTGVGGQALQGLAGAGQMNMSQRGPLSMGLLGSFG